MGRIVAIDYGTKRVGIAVTDPMKIIASPLDTVHAKDIHDYLKEYTAKEAVDTFVVGMPKNLNEADTHATQHVRGFVKKLRKQFPQQKVHEVDERFTSKMALDAMIASGTTKKQRRDKSNIDKVSATILLQDFLNSHNA